MAETKTLLTETKTLAYQLPDQSALAAEGAAAKATASILVIDDQKSLEIATQEMTALAKRRKELEAARKAITGPLDQAKKSTMALFKPVIQDIDDAIAAIKDGIARYTVEQERLAAIERAKAPCAASMNAATSAFGPAFTSRPACWTSTRSPSRSSKSRSSKHEPHTTQPQASTKAEAFLI